jgi:hypothetical protein
MQMNKLLTWIGETFSSRKKRIVNDPCGAGPYLTRYYLFGHRTSRYALMLHHFHRSDMDRDLHDHPWPFWSLILSGGYWEVTPWRNSGLKFPPNLAQWFRPFSVLKRPANWTHRVALQDNRGPVWTLVLRGKYERKWGFHTREGFVPFDKYNYEQGCE